MLMTKISSILWGLRQKEGLDKGLYGSRLFAYFYFALNLNALFICYFSSWFSLNIINNIRISIA